jgi:hypothetical protein
VPRGELAVIRDLAAAINVGVQRRPGGAAWWCGLVAALLALRAGPLGGDPAGVNPGMIGHWMAGERFWHWRAARSRPC